MESIRVRLFHVLVLLFFIALCFSRDLVAAERVIVLASPVGIDFASYGVGGDAPPPYYLLKVKDVRTVVGKQKFRASMKVLIRTHDPEAVLANDRVALVIEDGVNGERVAVYWSSAPRVFCVPPELVDDQSKDYFFDDKFGGEGKCMFVRGAAGL